MSTVEVAITIDAKTLERVDDLVTRRVFPSRSRAIQLAVSEKLARLERRRLAQECAKLNPASEQALAEGGLGEALGSWPVDQPSTSSSDLLRGSPGALLSFPP